MVDCVCLYAVWLNTYPLQARFAFVKEVLISFSHLLTVVSKPTMIYHFTWSLKQEAGFKPTFHNRLWFLSLKYSCRSPTKAVCGHCERKQLFSYSVYVQIIPSPCHRHHLKSKNLAAPRDWSTLVESNNPQPIYKTGPITAWVSVDIYNKQKIQQLAPKLYLCNTHIDCIASKVVLLTGVEPVCSRRGILSPLCLPIPPQQHICGFKGQPQTF